MDNELLELCKQVYEKTKWEVPSLKPFDSSGDPYTTYYIDGVFQTYIYTVDYLLEKLPKQLPSSRGHWLVLMPFDEKKWSAIESKGKELDLEFHNYDTDTPLKALLKLTLALKEAGAI